MFHRSFIFSLYGGFLFIGLFCGGWLSADQDEPQKIGFVDMSELVSYYKEDHEYYLEYIEEKKKIIEEGRRKSEDIRILKKKYRKLDAEIQGGGDLVRQKARLLDEINFFEEEASLWLAEKREYLEALKNKNQKKFLQEIYGAIRKYASENEFDMIVDLSAPRYYYDYTNDVTKEMIKILRRLKRRQRKL